jgi:hypothetical protein
MNNFLFLICTLHTLLVLRFLCLERTGLLMSSSCLCTACSSLWKLNALHRGSGFVAPWCTSNLFHFFQFSFFRHKVAKKTATDKYGHAFLWSTSFCWNGGTQGCQILLDTISQKRWKIYHITKNYQIVIKYNKWAKMVPMTKNIPKFSSLWSSKIGIFGFKIYHLATLVTLPSEKNQHKEAL